MAKQIKDSKSDYLREEFLERAEKLADDIRRDIREFEQAFKDGKIGRNYLPLNVKMALRALKSVETWRKKELRVKIDAALDGTLRYREAERRQKVSKKTKSG